MSIQKGIYQEGMENRADKPQESRETGLRSFQDVVTHVAMWLGAQVFQSPHVMSDVATSRCRAISATENPVSSMPFMRSGHTPDLPLAARTVLTFRLI